MKCSRLFTALTAGILSFLLSFGSIGGFADGFDLACDLQQLLICCAACALIFPCFLVFRRGSTILLCFLALLGGYLWQQGTLVSELSAILARVSGVYHRAYGWGVIQWGGPADTVTLALGGYGSIISLTVCRALCHRRGIILATLVSTIPLVSCLVVTNTLPGSRWLYCFLLGLILLLLTQAVRRRSAADGVRLTWLLAVPAALGLAGLFLLMPPSDYQGQPQAQQLQNNLAVWAAQLPSVSLDADSSLSIELTPPSSHRVNLRHAGPRQQSRVKVMEVTADTGGSLYLRGRSYDIYDGTGWSVSEGNEWFLPPENAVLETAGTVTVRTYRNSRIRYFPYYPSEDLLLTDGALMNENGAVTYQYRRNILTETGTVGQFSGASLAEYTQLPDATAQWAVQYLSEHLNLTAESVGSSVVPAAAAIADWVRQSAVYDLDTAAMPGDESDFARWFLEDSDTGYCVHYATATVVLLRAAGIPARYVEGYLTTTQPGQAVTVTGKNAHAWAEYYLPGVGWVMLESTGTPEDAVAVWATEDIAAPPSLQSGNETAATVPVTAPTDRDAAGIRFPVAATALSLLLPMLLVLQWRLRLAWRRRAQRRGSINHRCLAKWQEAARLARQQKQHLPVELVELALRAKYSRADLTESDLLPFDEYRRTSADRLRHRPLPVRLWNRLILALY